MRLISAFSMTSLMRPRHSLDLVKGVKGQLYLLTLKSTSGKYCQLRFKEQHNGYNNWLDKPRHHHHHHLKKNQPAKGGQ